MTQGDIYEGTRMPDKFHVGDELYFCDGALEFAEIIEEHMGVEAREYFTDLVNCLLAEAMEDEDDE